MLLLNCIKKGGVHIKNITKFINALGTMIIINIDTKNEKRTLKELDKIEMLINEYNIKWSLYNNSSLINKINNSNDYVLVDFDTLKIIKDSSMYSIKTKGYFDITTAKLNLLWKSVIKSKVLPTKKEIIKEIKNVNYKKIIIKDNKIKLGKNQKIDLGAIAKGFILDKIKNMLNMEDILNGIINLGGTIYTIGEYNIGIRNPFKPVYGELNSDYILTVKLMNECIVTSGIYEQETIIDGISYNHIINPKDGYPTKSDLLSISLIGNNASMLDAYATALFNMEIDESLELLNDEKIDAIFIFKNGSIYITDKAKNKIEKRNYNENK